jgi:hypothetical protein
MVEQSKLTIETATLNERLNDCNKKLLRLKRRRLQYLTGTLPLFDWTDEPHPDKQLISRDEYNVPIIHFHAGQVPVWKSSARFVAAIAGSQSGKTTLGPWWLLQRMIDYGPGNYMLVAGTFTLLGMQAVPTLKHALETILGLGTVIGGSHGEFRVSEEGHKKIWPDGRPYEPTRIVFGYAANPNSLESITAKAAWLDECGAQEFKQESYEAIQARLSINRGRILFTSTPYVWNWFKYDVYDRAERNRNAARDAIKAKEENREPLPPNPADDGYESFNYESRANPVFPMEEWERQKLVLPGWKFDSRYCGLFTRPAGAIYDCFDELIHKLPGKDFALPEGWPIYCGIDFGAPHFRATFLYQNMQTLPDGKLTGTNQYVAFAEYAPEESKKLADHVASMRKLIGKNPDYCVGGAKSEGQWRAELQTAGWPTSPPDQPDVEVGIGRVYAMFANEPPQLYIMDTCPKLLEEVERYSRPVDEDGNPMEGIEDKDMFHSCFIAGTMVTTDCGLKPVEQVRIGDRVLTRQGYFPVAVSGLPTERELIQVDYEGGSLTGSPDHPVFVEGKGFVRLDTLRYVDRLVSCENNMPKFVTRSS